MRYFLDTEFDGFGGPLLSMALVREDGQSMYGVFSREATDPWVRENVLPILDACPPSENRLVISSPEGFAKAFASWIAYDIDPVIVTDWPDDIRYFCGALITGPGQMVNTGTLRFEMKRVDAYPTAVAGAVQHNAWWDAVALREKLCAA